MCLKKQHWQNYCTESDGSGELGLRAEMPGLAGRGPKGLK